MRTSSEPAIASSLTWIAVPIASTVSVLVIACTRTGASPPIVTTRAPQRDARLARAARRRLRRHDEGVGRGGDVVAHRSELEARWLLQLDAGDVVARRAELDRLTAKAELRSRRVADADAERRLAVEAERFAGLDQARQQGSAARVGHFDP